MLYEVITVDEMFKNGLLEEVYNVYSSNKLKTAYQAIGYKELLPYFENKATLEECKDKLKQQTRRYAKRQLTWFRRDSRIDWIVLDSIKPQKENIIKNAKNIIENSVITSYSIHYTKLYEEVVTENFKRFLNKTVTVLVEGEGKTDSTYLTGKNDENIIVEFKGHHSLIGEFVNVKITKIKNWALFGEIINN